MRVLEISKLINTFILHNYYQIYELYNFMIRIKKIINVITLKLKFGILNSFFLKISKPMSKGNVCILNN